ncbi:MAG: hypothetical protein QOG95_2340, partial [Mycobacterium sp.]|nr:hypothetical protein [Mycobacterium sp.]
MLSWLVRRSPAQGLTGVWPTLLGRFDRVLHAMF